MKTPRFQALVSTTGSLLHPYTLDRLITNVQAGISPGDQNKMLVKSVEELEEQKRRMEDCQVGLLRN